MLKFLRHRFYGKQKLMLAFEYGVILSQVAQEQGVEMTPELMEKAEFMLENEFKDKTPTELSTDMASNLMSVFELDLSE